MNMASSSTSRRNGLNNNNNNGSAANGDIQMDYGPNDTAPSKRGSMNGSSANQLAKPAAISRSGGLGRRSSLGLEDSIGGGGVPNPYGYTHEARPSRAVQRQQQRAAAAAAAANNNTSGNGKDLKLNPAGARASRRDSGMPGRGNTASLLPPGSREIAGRGRGGVIGIVRQSSGRGSLEKMALAAGAGRGGGRGGGSGGRGGGARQQQQHQQQSQKERQKRLMQEATAASSRQSLLSQDSALYSASSAGGADFSYNSLFYEDETDGEETLGDDSRFGDDDLSGGDESLRLMNVMDETQEIRQTSSDAKKDALVESLVWFSHHTPRTVLEDLVSHEIEIWQAERGVDMTIMEESCESLEESNSKGNSFNQSLTGSSHHSSSNPYHRNNSKTNSNNRRASSNTNNKKKSLLGSIRDDESESFMGSSRMGESAVSDLSDEGMEFYDGNFSESILKLQAGQSNTDVMIKLPKVVEREGAVVFADISGFTKLSTMLDCESLSKVINSYFDMIVNEVVSHGGDILKFAGDAFFAEWKVNDYDDGMNKAGGASSALSNLNASLSTLQDVNNYGKDDNMPRIATCVLAAAKCAAAIVEKFSDFSVGAAMPHAMPMVDGVRQEAILNVHCGLGAGKFVGLHVGDYKEDPDEEGVELRREFLVMGDPIDQAALAADAATDGEVLASPKALSSLAYCCHDLPQAMKVATSPALIAARGKKFFSLEGNKSLNDEVDSALNNEMSRYEALRTHCRDLNQSALARLHLQMALYVHPVIRDDELALSAQIRQGKIAAPQSTIEDRHLAEAELRSVFTIFIKAVMTPKITGDGDIDGKLYAKLGDIMHVVSRELDRYSGHLRQFIVDDKGVVLIATFGLRGSTFPNMVANNGLPATFAIHRSLKSELQVDNRVGATFGKVYCGVVGGVRRHEFAVMGAAVNLAARLMAAKMNKGILVDEQVRAQAGSRFDFKNLPSIKAKGYDNPVAVFEPDLMAAASKKKKSSVPFVGRREERNEIAAIAQEIIEEPDPTRSSMVFLMGECGMGKSALGISILEEVKKAWAKSGRKVIAARSTTTETEQRIPLSSFRKVFLSAIRDLCEHDGTVTASDDTKSVSGSGSDLGHHSLRGQSRSGYRPGLARTDRGKPLESLLGDSVSRFGDASMHNDSFHTEGGNSFEVDTLGTSTHSGLGLSSHSGHRANSLLPASLQRAQTDGRAPGFLSKPQLSRGASTHSGLLGKPQLSRGLSVQSAGMGMLGLANMGNPQAPFNKSGPSSRHNRGSLGASLHGSASLAKSLHGGGPDGNPASMALKRRESNVLATQASGGALNRRPSLSQSLHGGGNPSSLHGGQMWPKTGPIGPVAGTPTSRKSRRSSLMKHQSTRKTFRAKSKPQLEDIDGNESVMSLTGVRLDVPYFEKLCQICEEIEYPHEYADIVGSQFLGLDGASPVTHVDGHVPTINELVEFLSQAFICITNYSDLSLIFVDDFQWVDSFTWKIFRELCERGKKMLLICAMRSHDKQALRRLSTAITQSHMQSQMIEISLGPLDLLEIREMIAKVLGYGEDAVDESLCSDIYQKTGGLPVYVAELLENIKRNKTVAIDDAGILRWTAQAEEDQKGMASKYNSGAVMEETFLSRFDALDVRVRKVLQTCAVLGLSFSLSDVVRVHPELEEIEIEHALDNAVEEIILVERFEDEDESVSLHSGSTGCDSDSRSGIHEMDGRDSRTSMDMDEIDDRFFEFSHAMWRQKVLTTMLKERKIELHRLIAEAMEKDQVHILEQCDISRLLTLFDHWKACGDFCKSAPLALAVGSRLEEWDLAMQSLDLYRDALEMSFESVEAVDENGGRDDEWVQVSAHPEILDLILRLHIRIGLCHQRLGDEYESVMTFEDAYKIVKTSSKIPGMSRTLMMPIISTLCALKLEREATDMQTRKEQEGLVRIFVEEAREDGHPVHISRALAMAAMYFAKQGYYERALAIHEQLQNVYDVLEHSGAMIQLYGYDYAVECFSESVQWYYLVGRHESAERQAEIVIHDHVPLQDQTDIDNMLRIILPVIQVLKLLDRAKDSDLIFKKFIINSFHDHSQESDFWVPLFNPLAYLLEVIKMEEEDNFDHEVLKEMESWVLDDENSVFHVELERKAHTWMGELCWRLSNLREDDDPVRLDLCDKARELLEPIAWSQHQETFLKQLASALLDAL
ncbi:cyclase type 10 [Seminavis robusta]|uniref:Cyclase type 10 n=1 Tax=Seminavis robusta TaxID=568900 RepID=A0A9N8HFR1_9STRA|nr:cyclase type 10 [Seminavis robusta]|eukprot:Sro447_g144870.1 cyclase type 10 (2175) ;mRNA; r:25765-32786